MEKLKIIQPRIIKIQMIDIIIFSKKYIYNLFVVKQILCFNLTKKYLESTDFISNMRLDTIFIAEKRRVQRNLDLKRKDLDLH